MKYQIGLQILVLAMTFSFSIGCMKVKKKDEALKNETTKQETVTLDTEPAITNLSAVQLKIQYQGQSKPNQYTAQISWPETAVKSMFRIIRANAESREFTENSINLENLVGGQESKITFEQYEISTQKRLASFEVFLAPPKDFVFDGVVSLQQNVVENVERLFFTVSAKVYTNQFNLKITAKNLYSEFGAMLSNFPEGSVAEIETVGLSGGKTEITSDLAEGNLQVIMNAQQGGQGLAGWMQDDKAFGCLPNGGGISGNSGSFFLESKLANFFSYSFEMQISPKGKTGEQFTSLLSGAQPAISQKHKPLDYKNCQKPIVESLPGKPGQICTKMSSTENFKCEKF